MDAGMIGLACSSILRTSDFVPSLMGLVKPPGTVFMKGEGLGPARPFNGIAAEFLKHDHLKWLFLTNDDNLCPAETIPKLLSHNVDVVSGLYFGRIQPFEPILFDKWTWEANDQDKAGQVKKKWWHRHFMAKGEHGLVRAAAVGDGCLLIRRHVLEAMEAPWWEYGETFTDTCDHDVVFSNKVIEAGFGVWCDLDLMVDHVANFAIRPFRDKEGNWTTRLMQGAGRELSAPVASPDVYKDIKPV